MTDFFAARIIHREMNAMTDLRQKLEMELHLAQKASKGTTNFVAEQYRMRIRSLESCLIMLEALERIKQGYDKQGRFELHYGVESMQDIARTTIAKVTERMR